MTSAPPKCLWGFTEVEKPLQYGNLALLWKLCRILAKTLRVNSNFLLALALHRVAISVVYEIKAVIFSAKSPKFTKIRPVCTDFPVGTNVAETSASVTYPFSKRRFEMMIRNLFLSGAILLFHAFSQKSFAQEAPLKIPSPVDKIFVPLGFDSNDNVEVILHGDFSSTCQKVADASAKVLGDTIEIEAYSYQYSGEDCQELRHSFIQTVKIGTLQPNNYTIKYKFNETLKSEPLNIVQTLRSEPDDYLYAPVSSADFYFDQLSGNYFVNVEGYFPRLTFGCMYIEEVRTYLSPGNVVVVQPIAKMNMHQTCHGGPDLHHFKIATKVDFPVRNEEYLLHVRVLNGNSYNQFIEHLQ